VANLDVPQLVVAADHEVRGDRRPVGAGRQVGHVAFQSGQVPGLRLEFPVDAFYRAVEGDEPVPLDRGEPGEALAALATCSPIPRRARRARSALYW
jgi:hypothetical protein